MVEEIHEILCTILKLLHISGENADLPKAILYDITKFTQYGNPSLIFFQVANWANKFH
jgi:hypothetical protein